MIVIVNATNIFLPSLSVILLRYIDALHYLGKAAETLRHRRLPLG